MLPFLCLLFCAHSQAFAASSNFSVDLMGAPDTRPSTWGDAGAQTWKLTFKPPAGQRTRVLHIAGDLLAWPKVLPGDAPVPPSTTSGVLLSFQTTAPGGSVRCDWCADNTMLYLQEAVMDRPGRFSYDSDTRAAGLLEADNQLVIVVATFLNTTGKYIHIEPTFTVTYQFEPKQ